MIWYLSVSLTSEKWMFSFFCYTQNPANTQTIQDTDDQMESYKG